MVGLGVDLGDLPDYVGHNDLATAQLLRALAARGFDGRLVLASSMVVYGEGRYACPEHGVVAPGAARGRRPRRRAASSRRARAAAARWRPAAVPEDAPLDPRSVYAATKLAQEHLCAAFARETGVPVTALRYHNVYGPRMPRDTPYAGVASIFRSAYAAGRAPRVFEDGGQRRDFVHVRDVARANLLALTAPEPVAGRVQRRERDAAHGARDGAARSPRRAAPPGRRRSSRASGARATCATSSPRRRAPPSGSASARRRTSTPGWRSSPPRRCAAERRRLA